MPAWSIRSWNDPIVQQRWLTEGVISFSEDEIDVADGPSDDDLRWRLSEALPLRPPRAIGNFTRYWRQWLDEMTLGEVILAPWRNRQFGLGVIQGDAVRQDEHDPRLRHRRKVDWHLGSEPRDNLPEALHRISNLPATITKINEPAPLSAMLAT